MSKGVSLPKSNLYLVGSGLDINGNRVVKVSFPNSRAFSIQMSGNLPDTYRLLRGLKTVKDMESISNSDLAVISKEVCAYLKKYGKDTQKKKLRIY